MGSCDSINQTVISAVGESGLWQYLKDKFDENVKQYMSVNVDGRYSVAVAIAVFKMYAVLGGKTL